MSSSSVSISSIGGLDSTINSQDGDNTVVGTAEANQDVYIFFGEIQLGTTKADDSGIFSYSLTDANLSFIGQGSNKYITASQTDLAGNTGSSPPFSFAVDTVAPLVSISSIGGGGDPAELSFKIYRTGNLSQVSSVNWTISSQVQPIPEPLPDSLSLARANNLRAYLKSLGNGKYLFGQVGKWVHGEDPDIDDDGNWVKQVYNHTGKWPGHGVTTYDYKSPNVSHSDADINSAVLEMWDRGIIPGVYTFWGHPGGKSWNNNMDIGLLFSEDSNPDKSNFYAQMDRMATNLQWLQDRGVPVIYTPLVESNDINKWHAKQGAENAIKLYQLIHDYFVNDKGLKNIVWSYHVVGGGAMQGFYPGDSYVDIIGSSVYGTSIDFNNYAWAASKKKTAGKIVFISELGIREETDIPRNSLDVLGKLNSSYPDVSGFVFWGDNEYHNVTGNFNGLDLIRSTDIVALDLENTSVATNDVAVWWSFDDWGGTKATSSSSIGNTGKLVNMRGNEWVAGRFGNALAFDGIDDYVSKSTLSSNINGDVTVSFWMRTYSHNKEIQQTLFDLGDINNSQLTLYTNPDNGFLALANHHGGQSIMIAPVNVVDGSWHHIAVARNHSEEGETKIYVDGILRRSSAITDGTPLSLNSLIVGNSNGFKIPYHGLIDDFRVYTKALNETEVLAIASPEEANAPSYLNPISNPKTTTSFQSGTVIFNEGEASKTVSIGPLRSQALESGDRFRINLDSAEGAIISSSASSLQDIPWVDDLFFAISGAEAYTIEGLSGEKPLNFIISRSGNTAFRDSVYWSVVGSGPNPASIEDFKGTSFPGGQITFDPGETSKKISIQALDVSHPEEVKGFGVILSNPSRGIISTPYASGIILNNAGLPAPLLLTAETGVALEGNSGSTTFKFIVMRSEITEESIGYSWSVIGTGISPAGADDFKDDSLPSGSISFKPGESSKEIVINARGDTLSESDETFSIVLWNPAIEGTPIIAAAAGTILNDDLQPSPPPPAPGAITNVADNAGTIQGSVANGNRTDDRTPTITGTISAALAARETLRIYNGYTLLGSANVDNIARTWSYTPTLPNTAGTTYSITARVANAEGKLGNTFTARTFILDTTAPTVSYFSPADGATGVAIGSNLTLSFREAIAIGTGTITLRSGSATGSIIESFDAATSSQLSISGSTLTVDPTNNLAANTRYFLALPSGSVKDIAGNKYTGTSSYDFRTVSGDTTAPTVSYFSPADGATGVAIGSNLTLSFREAIAIGTGTITLRSGSATGSIIESFDAATSSQLSISGSTLTVDPTNNLAANTRYFLALPSGSVKDIAGNKYTGTSSYDFSTVSGDTTPPTVTALSVNGSTLTLTLSEALSSVNPANSRFRVLVGGARRNVNLAAVNISNNTVSLTLASAVTSGQNVSLAYKDATAGNDTTGIIQDVAGNDLATFSARAVTNSTVASETTPPTDTASSFSPYNWSNANNLAGTPGVLWANTQVASPRSNEPALQVNALRVDLKTPGLSLINTPRINNWQANSTETLTETTRDFITGSRLQGTAVVAAINTAFFDVIGNNSNQSLPTNLLGLAVSNSTLISPNQAHFPYFVIDRITGARIESNPNISPDLNTTTVAFAGQSNGIVLWDGKNTVNYSSGTSVLNARTALGLSSDQRYMYLMTVDRSLRSSSPTSYWGATIRDMGDLLYSFGASSGINLDGGGSTQMGWWDPNRNSAQLLNAPLGVERYVGSNLGIVYQPTD